MTFWISASIIHAVFVFLLAGTVAASGDDARGWSIVATALVITAAPFGLAALIDQVF